MSKYRRPSEMKPTEDRVPVSTRLRSSLKAKLSKEAKAVDLSLAELIENVLEDYSEFLEGKRK